MPVRNPFGRQLLKPSEVAWALGMRKSTILRWIREGHLKEYGTYNRKWVDWDEVVTLLEHPPARKPYGPARGTGGRPPKCGPGKPARSTGEEIRLMDAAIAGLRDAARRKDALAKEHVGDRPLPVV